MKLFDLALAKIQENVQTAYLKMYREVAYLPESNYQEFIENVVKPLSDYIFNDLPADLLSITHSAVCDRLQYLMFQLNTLSNYELCLIYLIGFHHRLKEHSMTLAPIDTSNYDVLNELNDHQNIVNYCYDMAGHFYDPEINRNLVLSKDVMISMIPTFINLTEIKLRKVNDVVLGIVLTNCKKLSKVDVSESTGVTDGIIDTLLKATDLRLIDLSYTSISIQGYLKLFEQLKQIVYFGISFPLITAVETAIRENRSGFGLKRAFLTIEVGMIMPDLSRVLPLLSVLEIVLAGENVQSLYSHWDNLCKLNLTYLIVHNGRIDVGESIHDGQLNSLKCLELYETAGVSVGSLQRLDIICPNLETLKIKVCNERLGIPYSKEKPLFKNLKDFQCESSILRPQVYRRILADCKSIINISIKNCPTGGMNASLISKILTTNKLTELESIDLNPCRILERNLIAMLDGCRKLKYVNTVYNHDMQQPDNYQVLRTMSGSRVYDQVVNEHLTQLAAGGLGQH